MYLSHPVRRMRDDPISEETVTLVVTCESGRVDAVAEAIEACGASVVTHLEFDALRVETTEKLVAEICGLQGIESVETGNAIGVVEDDGI